MVIPDRIIKQCKTKIPIIVGPTATGKTAFSIQLAKQINGEIISVDSRQIYKGFCIGTAQPSKNELISIRHHLINCLEPHKIISAGKYCDWVWHLIDEIKNRKCVPILAGGTLLYIRSIYSGIIRQADVSIDIRNKVKNKLQSEGSEKMMNELKVIDPEYSEIVNQNDHKRLARAFEIFYQTKIPPSELFSFQQAKDKYLRSKYYLIELKLNREILKKLIHKRTQKMIENGWLNEVKNLLQNKIDKSCHPMQGLGYIQMQKVLDGKMTIKEAENCIVIKTWQYARRQLTWLKKMDCDYSINMD